MDTASLIRRTGINKEENCCKLWPKNGISLAVDEQYHKRKTLKTLHALFK